MLAHHLAAVKQTVHSNLIAEFKFRTALFREGSLLIREVAAVLIAEEQRHGIFVDGLTMTGVPLADDVLYLFGQTKTYGTTLNFAIFLFLIYIVKAIKEMAVCIVALDCAQNDENLELTALNGWRRHTQSNMSI